MLNSSQLILTRGGLETNPYINHKKEIVVSHLKQRGRFETAEKVGSKRVGLSYLRMNLFLFNPKTRNKQKERETRFPIRFKFTAKTVNFA